VHVLVPVKQLDLCKQRLAGILDAGERRLLMLRLLDDVIGAARNAAGATSLSIVTGDSAASAVAATHGIPVVDDGGLPWNEGLLHALAQIPRAREGVLFLSADLPAVSADDVAAMIEACPAAGVAIGRAHGGDTNALALRPAAAIVPAFGAARSATVHAARASAAGVAAILVDRPGLAHDLDTPEDLTAALANGGNGAARAWRTYIEDLALEGFPC
jgi:2-phospho-L-lactate/phosphoenolpyruvate guanylyltransferase